MKIRVTDKHNKTNKKDKLFKKKKHTITKMSQKKTNNDKKGLKTNKKITEKEKLILKELIKNPRVSDNQISKTTGIPVKTVNRRRKYLEDNNLVVYSSSINNYEKGTGRFGATCMYSLFFKFGITKEKIKGIITSEIYRRHPAVMKHIMFDFVGEKEGSVVYTTILVSRASADFIEILNAEIIPFFSGAISHDCISKVEEMTVGFFNKTGHNNYAWWVFSGERPKEIPDKEIYIFD